MNCCKLSPEWLHYICPKPHNSSNSGGGEGGGGSSEFSNAEIREIPNSLRTSNSATNLFDSRGFRDHWGHLEIIPALERSIEMGPMGTGQKPQNTLKTGFTAGDYSRDLGI